MIPTAEVHTNLQIKDKYVNNFHMEWLFSDIYSAKILNHYDKNGNQILDKNELKLVLDAMLEYLQPKEMLTKIEYSENEKSTPTIIKPEYKNFDMQIVNGFLIFTYDAEVSVAIKNKTSISLSCDDNDPYFNFITTKMNIEKSEFSYTTQNLYLFSASVFFSDIPTGNEARVDKVTTATKEESSGENILEVKQKVKVRTTQETNQTKDKEAVTDTKEESLQANILKESIIKIKSLFESIKDEKNPLTYMALLFFAYLYGLIHALGPGHGKTLVASYFLSNERSYSKALFVSLAIGVVHTFSAFILTLVIYFMVNTFLAQFLNDAVLYTTKISAVIIIFIALYLIYKKYKVYKQIQQEQIKPTYSFSTVPHANTCGCASCKVDNNSTDMALIISAGIIPCPGTVTLFIFSLSLGLYYAGFLSAFVMSLGMSTIIFFSALLSVVVRKKTSNSTNNVKKYLEYGSLIVILLLGMVLLFT
jgi:ABC-type nickel/cobalt efflux system permease component RcnA